MKELEQSMDDFQYQNQNQPDLQNIRFRKIKVKDDKQISRLKKSLSEYQSGKDSDLIDTMKQSNNAIQRQMGYAMEKGKGKLKTLKHQVSNQDSNL